MQQSMSSVLVLVLLFSSLPSGAEAAKATTQRSHAHLRHERADKVVQEDRQSEDQQQAKGAQKVPEAESDDEDSSDSESDEEDEKESTQAAESKEQSKESDPVNDEAAALKKAIKEAKSALDNNEKETEETQNTLDHFEDEAASDHEIDASMKLVANETQSPALAKMLGSMWKEMRMFEIPAYAKRTEKDIASLKATGAKLKANLADAEDQLKAVEESDQPSAASEDVKEDAVEEPAEAPEVFPVPTTARCIVIMVCQYMIIYTALAICRTYHELTGTAKGKVEAGLRAAAQTLTYGPMLCVLFIACRMRVEFLSHGLDQPPAWVQMCMYALTFAVLLSTLLVLVTPLVTGVHLGVRPGTVDVETPTALDIPGGKATFYTLLVFRYAVLVGLYGGLAGIIIGILTYTPPGVSDMSKLPAPAPAVTCTMTLAILFFFTQLVIAVCRTVTDLSNAEFPKVVGMMQAAATTVEFAPQLAILFLAARMRALQHGGQPQIWAQSCMYSATFALCATAVLACVIPLAAGGTMKSNPVTKEVTFEVANPILGVVLVAIRFLCMAYFYGGAAGVIYSIFVFESPDGPEHTLPVSATVRCIVNLTCQFFFIYLMQTVMLTISEVSGGRMPLEKHRFFNAMESAKAVEAFAPMLSILFVTTRMYALLITNRQGAPQAWVQDGMYMATWSLFISFVSCLATGLVVEKVETDEDANVVNKFSNKYATYTMVAVRYLAMLLLYGGILTVVIGLFVMTPETANGRGSVPVVTDIIHQTPFAKPPPNAQDVAEIGS